MLNVHACEPFETLRAVRPVVGVDAPDAVVSVTSMTCEPDSTTSLRGEGRVALHATAPLRIATTSETGLAVVLLAAARRTMTVPSAETLRCPSPSMPRPPGPPPGPPGPP